MAGEIDIHAWSPVVLALSYPGYFYFCLGAGFLLAAIAWWWLPHHEAAKTYPNDAKQQAQHRSSLRKDLSLFYSGSVIVIGIIGAIIQFQANIERDQRQQRATLSAENAKRFDEAVARLETNTALSQIGAISSFSELIKQEGFYWPVVAELHAFLRREVERGGSSINRAEIMNAFNVLSRRLYNLRDSDPFPLDFSVLSLSGLSFSGLQLWGSDFQHTNLSHAHLPGAKMESADFRCANFEGADFSRYALGKPADPAELSSKMSQVNFRGADLTDVDFKPTDKGAVDVEDACFEGAWLDRANISGFDLTKARGLTREKIIASSKHPPIPSDYQTKPCRAFADLCPITPATATTSAR